MLLSIITASLMGMSILAAPLDAGPAEAGDISGSVKAIEQGPIEPGVTSWGTPSLFERAIESSGLEERQRYCGYDDSLVGDGSPRTRKLNKQLSQTLRCSQTPGCSVGQVETISYTVSADLGGGLSWISGGFGVSKSYATGNSYTCPGQAGGKVCIWTEIVHTEYEVQTCATTGGACGHDCGNNRRITSPNSNQPSPQYYCVEGEENCGEQGYEYWIEG